MDTELNAYETNTRYSFHIEYGLALLVGLTDKQGKAKLLIR